MTIRLTYLLPDGTKASNPHIVEVRPGGDSFPKAVSNFVDIKNEKDVLCVVATASEDGVWSAVTIQPRADATIRFQSIPWASPLGWWHELHGVKSPNMSRGQGVRIGIVDEGLALQGSQSCVAHVTNLGASAYASNNPAHDKAFAPSTSHGQTVTSLLASRIAGTRGFEGMAPGADVFFCAAPKVGGGEPLDAMRVANAIVHLSEDHKCHLVSVSAGDSPRETKAIYNAVEYARSLGTLCFFAAGNKPGRPAYPARYNNCLAVGALGRFGFAPAGTYEEAVEKAVKMIFDKDHFLWSESAYGSHVEFIAAGANVICSVDGRVSKALCGTSYACPISVGVAAAILSGHQSVVNAPGDRKRSAEILSLLTNNSRASDPALSRMGVLECV